MQSLTSEQTGRTPGAYEPPRLRVIELATDEVLTTGCKLASGPTSGPTGGSPCLVAGCFAVGTS